jgi:hypothetical protein
MSVIRTGYDVGNPYTAPGCHSERSEESLEDLWVITRIHAIDTHPYRCYNLFKRLNKFSLYNQYREQ